MTGDKPEAATPHRRAFAAMLGSVVRGLQPAIGFKDAAWRDLLAEVGVAADDLADDFSLIPLERGFAAFELAAARAGRPNLGLDYAQSFPLGLTGPVGYSLVSASTVRDAVSTFARIMPLVATLRRSRLVEENGVASVVWQYPVAASVARLQYVTWGTATALRRLRPALPPGWKPLAIEFDIPPPANQNALRDHFGEGLRFDCPVNRVVFEPSLLDIRLPGADPRLFDMMIRLAALEQANRGIGGEAFEDEMRACAAELLESGSPTVEGLAAAAQISVAELQQGLRTHGLDFKGLLNDVRKDKALTYLRETELPITEITFALGYSDCSVFTRACHKWFGKSPRDVRRESQADGQRLLA